MKKPNASKGEIIIYQGAKKEVKLDVRLKEETVWLSQAQIAFLFGSERSVITKHLRNIFQSGELHEKSNVQKMHILNSDKPVKLYNLDAIISVGYRVNSRRATQFRIWATRTLKDHLIEGYTINEKRLKEAYEKFDKLQKTVAFLREKSQKECNLDLESGCLICSVLRSTYLVNVKIKNPAEARLLVGLSIVPSRLAILIKL